jgi:hypothetical protein
MFINFLILFSYVILCDFYPIKHVDEEHGEIGRDINWPEMLLIFWVSIFMIDEIRHVLFNYCFIFITYHLNYL